MTKPLDRLHRSWENEQDTKVHLCSYVRVVLWYCRKMRKRKGLVVDCHRAFLVQEMDYMAMKPKHPCRHPGCPELVPAGVRYCDKHKSMHPEESRSAASRGYGNRWRKARKAFLESHPLCEECLKHGRYVKATDVDHIVAHRGDLKLFWDRSNWQALCHSCHSKKTAREDSHPVYHL